jgi:hypothetical protein
MLAPGAMAWTHTTSWVISPLSFWDALLEHDFAVAKAGGFRDGLRPLVTREGGRPRGLHRPGTDAWR